MQIIGPNKKKWKLYVKKDINGRITDTQYDRYYTLRDYEEIDNFYFEASFSLNKIYRNKTSIVFEFEDNILSSLHYYMGAFAMGKFLDALLKNVVVMNNGLFSGFFTFVKLGKTYSIIPVEWKI